jgi:hypothetical protein
MAAPQRQPAAALAEARERKFKEWFEGRRWRIADDWTGERPAIVDAGNGTDMTLLLRFNHGRFLIPPPGRFHTPLGHGGRQGVIIIELDELGQDKVPERAVPFGITTLKSAQKAYGLIVGLPGGD